MTWRPSRTPRECREIKEQYTVGRFVIHSYGNGKQLFLVTTNPCILFSAINPNVCTQKNGEPEMGAMAYIPGSHLGPLHEHCSPDGDDRVHGLEAMGFDVSTAVEYPVK